MVLFNHATREMTAKIVYYGPGLCGKTTNLLVIFDKLDPKSRGKMLSLATKTDRTLFFDLLPVDIGKVGPFNLKIQLYTVPGQVFYNETRKLVLKGADSVVFVVDSQPSMVESNRESFTNLMENLHENQIDTNDIPIVIQFNKRDIPGVMEVEDLQQSLGFEGYPYVEASALKGDGVMETFKLVSKITAKHLIGKLGGKTARVEIGAAEPVQVPKAEPAKGESKKKKPGAKAPAPEVEEPAWVSNAPPDPEAALAANPFGGDVLPLGDTAPPFPESEEVPLGETYEKVEEVSLETLLEGRDRPLTLSGNVPLPVELDEEIAEPIPTAALIEEPEMPIAGPVTVASQPIAGAEQLSALQSEIAALRREIDAVRAEQRDLVKRLTKALSG
ncbi:MAG: ADP-ribosylation factor-like protein [Thermoanaerobaculia bacterium]